MLRHILCVLALATMPGFAGAAMQTTDRAEPAQTSAETTRAQSNRATAHDRHIRKHRAANHHHRHRATAKGNH